MLYEFLHSSGETHSMYICSCSEYNNFIINNDWPDSNRTGKSVVDVATIGIYTGKLGHPG